MRSPSETGMTEVSCHVPTVPPLEVRLLSSSEALSAGKQYLVACQAAGARPPALLTWTLGPTTLTSHTDKVRPTPTPTSSYHIILPQDVQPL